jgi:hypothetical protein
MFDTLGASLYHYACAARAIGSILLSKRLMLSPFSLMRVPRESSDWLMGASMPREAREGDNELFGRLFRGGERREGDLQGLRSEAWRR